MKSLGVNELPILSDSGTICGLFSQTVCLERILSGAITLSSIVSDCLLSTFRHVSKEDCVGKAARIVQNNGYAFVVDNGSYVCTLHRSDIFDFISQS